MINLTQYFVYRCFLTLDIFGMGICRRSAVDATSLLLVIGTL